MTSATPPCSSCADLESQLRSAEARADAAERERDVERSRFTYHADRFHDLAVALERKASSNWGHLRYELLASLQSAVKLFRDYAAGQPSPSNWRNKAEVAEARIASLRAALVHAEGYLDASLSPCDADCTCVLHTVRAALAVDPAGTVSQIREAALEDALAAVSAEQLEDPVAGTSDDAYEQAIRDALSAIVRLKGAGTVSPAPATPQLRGPR